MPMRRILLLAAALLVAGCGDHNLILKVDVLSFISPADRQQALGPIPAIPGGLVTGEVPVIDDQHVSLLQGVSDAAKLTSVTLTLGGLAVDSTGAGEDTVRIYMSDAQTVPTTTTPILTVPVVLTPGATDTLSAVLADDPRVLALFSSRQIRLSVTTSLRGPSSGSDLNGRFVMSELDAVVVAGYKGP